MDKYYTPQPFGNPPSLGDELAAHDPGNSSHWSVPHPGYALAGTVDTAVYQSAQLAYPESSQRTIVSPDAYLYYNQVRATPHSVSLSAPPQLPRESYDQLGQSYYPSPYDYSAFAALPGPGPYESADSTARDEGMSVSRTCPRRASESHRVSRRRCTEHALAAEPAGDHAFRLCHL